MTLSNLFVEIKSKMNGSFIKISALFVVTMGNELSFLIKKKKKTFC